MSPGMSIGTPQPRLTLRQAYNILINDLSLPLEVPRPGLRSKGHAQQIHLDLHDFVELFPSHVDSFVQAERDRPRGSTKRPVDTELWDFSQRLRDFLQAISGTTDDSGDASEEDDDYHSVDDLLLDESPLTPVEEWDESGGEYENGVNATVVDERHITLDTHVDVDQNDSFESEAEEDGLEIEDDDDEDSSLTSLSPDPSPTRQQSGCASVQHSTKRPLLNGHCSPSKRAAVGPTGMPVASPTRATTAADREAGARARRAAILAAEADALRNGVNAPGPTPRTPSRPAPARTGATRELDELNISTSKANGTSSFGIVSRPLFPSGNGTSPVKEHTTTQLQHWDPTKPLTAVPESQMFVEVLPTNRSQTYINNLRIRYDIQWEFFRLVEANKVISTDDVEFRDLDGLVGGASEVMPRIPLLVKAIQDRKVKGVSVVNGMLTPGASQSGRSSASPTADGLSKPNLVWTEMDHEEDSIVAQDLRGLGLAQDADGKPNRDWPYGGKLVYAVSVRPAPFGTGVRPVGPRSTSSSPSLPDTNGRPSLNRRSPAAGATDDPDNVFGPSAVGNEYFPFSFRLRPVEVPGKSTRLARRFGSRRILTIRFAEVDRRQRGTLFRMLLGRALVLFGRVFRVLWIPSDADSAIAVQTDELAPGLRQPPADEPPMPSFMELLSGYNDINAKPNQAMAKWAARFQLIMSDSVPATSVEPNRITVVPDIVSSSAADPDNPATTEILTDGCGLMYLARRILLHPNFGHLRGRPHTVQMRIGGAKGVLSVMSDEQAKQYPGMDVVLRDSMVKSFPAPEFASDPSLFMLDVVRVDGLKHSTSLSSEPIVFLEHNGVPADVLVSMSERGLIELADSFHPYPRGDESEEQARDRLIGATYSQGGVKRDRQKRDCISKGWSTKVAGLTLDSSSESNDDESPGHMTVDCQNMSAAEKLYETLVAGFRPTLDPSGSVYVASKLRVLIKTLSDAAVNEFRVPLEQSATAFIVPDTLGVLAPNEIFMSFASSPPINPVTQRCMTYLEGDCLAFRSPCKLPTDVRKFKAVVRPELFHLRDCVVMSANSELCTASPASFLGGGDYDGDTVTVIWDPALVEPFSNAPDSIAAQPANFEAENFIKDVVTVRQFLDALDGADEPTRIINTQHFLLASMLDQQLTGIYSGLHDNAVYRYGPAHQITLRLAHMFCSVLDARKSGLSVRDHILRQDRRGLRGEVAWRRRKKGIDQDGQYNVDLVRRDKSLGEFIMDRMLRVGEAKQEEILSAFPDPDREYLREDMSSLSELFGNLLYSAEADENLMVEVNLLVRHVQLIRQLWAHIYISDDRTPITDLYRALWARGPDDPLPGPMEDARRQTRSPSKGNRGRNGSSGLVEARKKELAYVWYKAPPPTRLPSLVPYGHIDFLTQLKVSCAAHLIAQERKAVKLPFEMDLYTTCHVKARSRGPVRALPADISGRMRPAWSY